MDSYVAYVVSSEEEHVFRIAFERPVIERLLHRIRYGPASRRDVDKFWTDDACIEIDRSIAARFSGRTRDNDVAYRTLDVETFPGFVLSKMSCRSVDCSLDPAREVQRIGSLCIAASGVTIVVSGVRDTIVADKTWYYVSVEGNSRDRVIRMCAEMCEAVTAAKNGGSQSVCC